MEFVFGGYILDATRGELRGPDGTVPLEPRAFSLLAHMLEHPGRLIDKDELIAAVWGGRIVSDAAISTAIRAVRRGLCEDGVNPTWLVTVRGRGFRFDGEVRRSLTSTTASPIAQKTPSMAIFDRPSVLVVGFECTDLDGRDTALALGLAQEVRLNLSHWRWFPVIGPEALGYRTVREIDIRDAGRDLGAAFALTGSVRSIGDRVRVNVTLTETGDGRSLWSRHFDGSLENLFDFEEEISRAIVAQIEPELSRANSQRLMQSPPTDLSAWELLLAANQSQRRGGDGYGTPEANEEQKRLVTEALEKDPQMARAWAWLAKCHWRETLMGWTADREAGMSKTLDASQTAMAINPANWEARCFRALALLFGRHEFVEAEFHAREAVRLNPSDAQARHILGCVLENIGRTEEALEHLKTVFVLNPNHPNASGVLGDLATCYMLLGQDAEAIEVALRLIALAPNYSRGLQRAVAALASAGEIERAREVARHLLTLQPDFNEGVNRQPIVTPYRHPKMTPLERPGSWPDAV